MLRPFAQVDVFASDAAPGAGIAGSPVTGNPVAVVRDAAGLSDQELAAFARWTNLSETTFLLPARDPAADYRLRIFTPAGELPFAGHPTLGSAAAWLLDHDRPATGRIVQECSIGLVPIRLTSASDGGDQTMAFGAPAVTVSEPLAESELTRIEAALGLGGSGRVLAHRRLVAGPEWSALLLDSAATVLELSVDPAVRDLHVGVMGPHRAGGPADYEVRAFAPAFGITEDPVTGSLNAALARWLIAEGLAPRRYTVRQGTVLGRDGRVTIESDGDEVWVGGRSRTVIVGSVDL